MKFIHCADLHIDSPMRGLRALDPHAGLLLKNIIRQSFENIIEACIKHNAEALLIAGDIFDGQTRDYNTTLWLQGQFLRIPNTRVFLIHGNHDYAALHSQVSSWPEHVHVFPAERASTVTWTNRDGETIAVHGQSFVKQAVYDNLALSYPEANPKALNLGLLHCSLEGTQGHDPYSPCQLSDLEGKDYGYWALGHIHQTKIKQTGTKNSSWVVYPGNIQGRHARELGKKGYVLVETQLNAILAKPEFIASDVLRWQSLDLQVSDLHEHPTQVIQDLCILVRKCFEEQEGRMLAVRLSLSGRSSLYAHLFENWQDFDLQVRTALSEFDTIWIEKIKLLCKPLLDETLNPIDKDIMKFIENEFLQLKENKTERGFINEWIEELEAVTGDLSKKLDWRGDTNAQKICQQAEQRLLNKLLSDPKDET